MEQIWTTSTGKQQGIDLLNAHAQWYYDDIEPATTYPFQNWADTGNNLWKQRNAENTTWIVRGKLSEAFFGLAPLSEVYTKIESDNKFGLLANAVIETGSNANGTWRKWADGTLECWGTKTFTSVTSTLWGGSIYVSGQNVTWPISFAVIESANINVLERTPTSFIPALIEFASSYQGFFYFWKPTSFTYDSITVGFYAKGRWQ